MTGPAVGPAGPRKGATGAAAPDSAVSIVQFVGMSMGGIPIYRTVLSLQDAPKPSGGHTYPPAPVSGPSRAKDAAKPPTPAGPPSLAYTHACEALKFLRGEPNNYNADFLAARRARLMAQLYTTPQFQVMSMSSWLARQPDEDTIAYEERVIRWAQEVRLLRYDGFENYGRRFH